MKKFLFYFAASCWTLALVVHLLSVASIDVTDKVPFVWVLHLGIFVVVVPAVISLEKDKEIKDHLKSKTTFIPPPVSLFIEIYRLRKPPVWLIVIAITGFIYGIINFILFLKSSHLGSPSIRDGQYILHNHGTLVKILTEQEYHHYKANEVRGFSGHWLFFYSIAATILHPFNKQKKDD